MEDDETEVVSEEDDPPPPDEGYEGGMTGSSDGAPYSAEGQGGATSSDASDGAEFLDPDDYFGPYDFGALLDGVVDGILHVAGELGSEGAVSGPPVLLVPKGFFEGMDGYEWY